MNDYAAKADAIFALTALSEDDVEPERAAVVVSKELEGIASLFEGFLADGFIDQESIGYFTKLVEAARFYSAVLLDDPHHPINTDDAAMPAYMWAVEVCMDAIEIIRGIDLQPEWKDHYAEQCKRVEFFALILKENPENLVRSV